jgi:hypothetical protein
MSEDSRREFFESKKRKKYRKRYKKRVEFRKIRGVKE